MAASTNALRATWGVTSRVSGVTGVVVGVDLGVEGSFLTETDLYGRVCAVFMYDIAGTFSADVLVRAGAQTPNLGSTIYIGNYAGYVKDVRITESNGSYQKLHITIGAHALVESAVNVTGL